MRKLLRISLLASVAMTCCFFATCKDPDEGNNPNPPDDGQVKSVTLSEEKVSVNVYDGFTLKTTLKGLKGTVTWSSSNEGVIIVENGNIQAVEIGTATITAELDGYKDTCEVTVHNDLMRAPMLEISATEVSLEKNGEYTVTADMLYNGVSLPKTYEYTWTVKAEDGSIVSVTPVAGANGKQAKLKGLAYGTAECYVSASTVGKEIINTVRVTVVSPEPSIYLSNFTQEQGKYTVNLSAIDANDGTDLSFVVPQITVLDGDEEMQNPALTWGGGDSEIAVVEENKIKAVGVGTTTFTLAYNQTQVSVEVNVYRPTITIEEVLEFESAIQTIAYSSVLVGNGEKAYLNGKEIGTVDKQTVVYDLSNAEYVLGEEAKATLWTDKAIYEFNAVVYTKVIKTVEEFESISTIYDTTGVSMGGYTYRQGYYVLGADLDFGRKTHKVCNFMGTFDGRGFTVSNMNLQKAGLFGYLRESAVVKNVIIKSAVLDVSGNAGVIARQAYNGFTISNVYAEVKYVGEIATSGSMGAGFIGQKLYNGYSENHEIEDCVIIADVSGLTARGEATAACFVGFVQHNPTLCLEDKKHQASEIFELKNSIAVVVGERDGGYTISDIYGSQSFTAETVGAWVYPIVTDTQVFHGAEAYKTWSQMENTNGYKADALRFIEECITKESTIETQVRNHLQGHPDLNMFGQTATVSLVKKQGNFNGFGSIEGEIQSLCLSDGTNLSEIENLTIELINNELVFTTTETSLVNVLGSYRGGKTVVLTTGIYEGETLQKLIEHNFYMTFADYVFTTSTEIRQFTDYVVAANTGVASSFLDNTVGNKTSVRTNGYFVLGQDIEFNSLNILATNYKSVCLVGGTFDGQDYTINKPKFYNAALFHSVCDGATVKDLKITNAELTFGSNATSSASIIASYSNNKTVISNVYVEVAYTGNANATANKRCGFIETLYNNGSGAKLTIKDCTIVASVAGLTSATQENMALWLGRMIGKADVVINNCITVMTDTNASGYTLPKFTTVLEAPEKIVETNCNYFADWTAYNSATLDGYNTNMLSFIEKCKQ